MKRLGLAAACLLLWTGMTAGQSVQQSGNVTPGHAARWITKGVIGDAGTAANGSISSFGVTASGPGICQNSGPITGAYNQLCLGVSTSSNAIISLAAFGGATPQNLVFNINGQTYTIPSTFGITIGTTTVSGGATGDPLYIASGVVGAGTRTGNTTAFATSNGTLTNGHCVSIDLNGNFVDAGGPCTTGGGGGTVTAGSTNQLAYYPGNAATVVGLATGNSGVLVTSAGGVPSISTTLPSGLTIPGYQAAGTVGQIQLSNGSGSFTVTSPATWKFQTLTQGGSALVPTATGGSDAQSIVITTTPSNYNISPGGKDIIIGRFDNVGPNAGGSVVISTGTTNLGAQAVVTNFRGTGLGEAVNLTGADATGIGAFATVAADFGVAIGSGSAITNSNAVGAIAIGTAQIDANGDGGVAIGQGSRSHAGRQVMIGNATVGQAACSNCIGIGDGANPGTTAGNAQFGGTNTLNVYAGPIAQPVSLHAANLWLQAPLTKTTSYAIGDNDDTVIFNCSGSCTATLPSPSSYTGRIINIQTYANQTVVSAAANVVPLGGGSAATAILAGTAGKWADLKSDATSWVIIRGN